MEITLNISNDLMEKIKECQGEGEDIEEVILELIAIGALSSIQEANFLKDED